MSVNSKMKAIADNIRAKTGGTEALNLDQIAEGVNEVYEAGKREGASSGDLAEFWGYYINPLATDLDYMFAGQRWSNTTFNPPAVALTAKRAMYMFARMGFRGDLAQRFEDCGFSIDFSQCVYIDNMFNNCPAITRIGVLDFSGAKSSAVTVFISCLSLVTIDKIIVGANTKSYSNWFNGCSALENLTMEGVIDKNGFSVQWSPKLTHDSLMTIINILADKSADTSGTEWKVTIGDTNLAKLTADERLIAEQKGWIIA